MFKSVRLLVVASIIILSGQISFGQQGNFSISLHTDSPKLKWYVGLDKQKINHIRVQLDTSNFPKDSCLSNFTFQVSFIDERGVVLHKRIFKLSRGLGEGDFYEDSLPYPYKSTHTISIDNMDYELINCHVRLTRLQIKRKSFWQKIWGLFKREKAPPKTSESQIGDERDILSNGPYDVRSTEMSGPLVAPEKQKNKSNIRPNQ